MNQELLSLLDEFKLILDEKDKEKLKLFIEDNHAIDVAELFDELDDEEVSSFVEISDNEDVASILEQSEEDNQERMVELFEDTRLLNIFSYMSKDDIVDIVGNMKTDRKKRLIFMMHDSQTISKLLGYEEDSAGGIMNTEYIALREDFTIRAALEKIKQIAPKTEVLETIFVLNRRKALVGVCDLRDILVHDSNETLGGIMDDNVISIFPEEDQEEASNLVSKYDLNALPVVSHSDVLLGIITLDDIIDVMEEEYGEDMSRMAGMGKQEEIDSTVSESVKLRLPWLMVNLITAFIAASVVGMFDSTIAQVTALAVANPIASGMGGNAGTQTLSVLVRAITLHEIDLKTGWQKVAKQLAVGIINGLCTGIVAGIVLYLVYGNYFLGVCITVALIGNLFVAGLMGFIVPLILDRFNLDPALGSSIFVTTATDCCGFFFFLGMATLLLPYLI